MENYLRASVQIYVATGADDGDFYVVSRNDSAAPWVRHATLTAAKAPGSPLSVKLDWPDRCGKEIAVEWARTAGAGTAQLYFLLDSKV
jgi:hypothetical protein